jgi:hypothetical protein
VSSGTEQARKVEDPCGAQHYHIGKRLGGSEEPPKPPVIDRREAIVPNRDTILRLAEIVRPRVAHLFDLDAFCAQVRGFEARSQSAAGLIIRATNLFQLVALACEQSVTEPLAS